VVTPGDGAGVKVALTGRRLAKYAEAIARAGADAVVVGPAHSPADVVAGVDAVVLGGGPDVDPACYGAAPHPEVYGVDPAVDAFELALCDAALAGGLPVLAICRGMQVLNVARGGSLHQHIPDDPGVPRHGTPGVDGGARLHEVALDPGSLVAAVMGTTHAQASCHHHQAVARPGDGLRVVARAADGIVEALQLDGAFVLAVQWHPEDTAADDPAQQRLFDALVRAPRAH
jgi:putative glutamine amidotransferase